jgi:hypothetical protein
MLSSRGHHAGGPQRLLDQPVFAVDVGDHIRTTGPVLLNKSGGHLAGFGVFCSIKTPDFPQQFSTCAFY